MQALVALVLGVAAFRIGKHWPTDSHKGAAPKPLEESRGKKVIFLADYRRKDPEKRH